MNNPREEYLQNMAIATLNDIWKQIDFNKVTSKRAFGIWDEFSSKVKVAAMTTNKYEVFVEKLCKKMDVRSLKFKNIKDISEESIEVKEAILKIFRNETQITVLKMRLNNQEKKLIKEGGEIIDEN